MDKEQTPPVIEPTSKVLNPFVHKLELNSAYDRFKLVFMSILILPFRVIGVTICLLAAYVLATAGLWGLSREELSAAPLQGWRGSVRGPMGFVGRMMMRCYGFHWVRIKGKMATKSEAPILVVGPHSSFFDCILCFWSYVPSLVNRIENLQIPFFGKYIDYTQPVYVWREDPNSRQFTIQEIKHRATSQEDWPQVMIFPEGTCTNRTCLITFKPGAFYPGVPVQPVLIKYPNLTDCVTWTWDGPGALKMLWVTLCQFHNYCEIEYLPVYKPSKEEQSDAKLFAANVRAVMAKALGIPVADYTYDDCRLMYKSKMSNLPIETGLVEFQKLKLKYGLNLKNVEEELLSQYAEIALTEGQISLSDFAQYLSLPESEPTLIELFNLYDLDGSGRIDFREYIICYFEHLKPANSKETLSWAFKLFDKDNKGCITCDDLVKALQSSLGISEETTKLIYKQVDVGNTGSVNYDDFVAHAKRKPVYAHIFLTYQRSIKEGSRSSTYPPPPPSKQKAE